MTSRTRQNTAELKAMLPTVDVVARDLYGIEFKRGIATCPFPTNHAHGDRDPSFRFDMRKNRVFCASQLCVGERGADAFELVQKLDGCGFPEAKERLAERYGAPATTSAKKSRLPASATKSSPDTGLVVSSGEKTTATAESVRSKLAREGYCVAAEYKYGDVLRKVRFEHASKRQVEKNRPAKSFRWEHCRDGLWYSGSGGIAKPLYVNSVFLERDPTQVVIGFEGEGKADLAAALGFPAFSFKEIIRQVTLSLADCDVVLWPDNDQNGKNQAHSAAEIIQAAGHSRSVSLLSPPEELPPGADIVDAVHHYQSDRPRIVQFVATAGPFVAEQPGVAASQNPSEIPFRVSDQGVFYLKKDSEGNIEPVKIAARLDVFAETCDVNGNNWGRLLRWSDNEGREHEWAMPMDMLAADASSVRARLLGDGLPFITTNNRLKERFTEYLQNTKAAKRIRSASRIGWHGDAYVLPGKSFGVTDGAELLYQAIDEGVHHWSVKGTAAEWREHVGKYCAGNSRLIIAVSCGFAGPLLAIAGAESGGIHFHGSTSTGKSTALIVGASVCGGGGQAGFVENWRNTINGLEAVAEAHNDSTLFLDELAQVDPYMAADTAYLLANGQGKGRMSRTMGMRKKATWTLLFISAGELTLAEHAASVGKRARGGAEIRLLNIKADAGKELGLFEELHGAASTPAFVAQLKEAAQSRYGAPYRAFLDQLVKNRRDAEQIIRDSRNALKQSVPAGATGEVSRAADRFAIIAAAGELATKWGLTGWQEGEATRGSLRCFLQWLQERGTSGSSDLEAGIERVRSFIAIHGNSRFQSIGRNSQPSEDDDDKQIVRERAGFRRLDPRTEEIQYLILPNVFRDEICSGYDFQAVARELERRGFLIRDGANLTIKPRLPGLGSSRVYAIRAAIAEAE